MVVFSFCIFHFFLVLIGINNDLTIRWDCRITEVGHQ